MELREGTLRHLQEYVAGKIRERGFEDESLHERMILLTEEVGELARACRKLSGMNINTGKEIRENAGEEVADVINMALAVAIKLNLDVDTEFREKEKEVDTRVYERAKSVE
jgi:NTP pyrophosphatase (non-canonical NTP hydrolase)